MGSTTEDWAAFVSTTGTAGSGTGFLNKPNAIYLSGEQAGVANTILALSREVRVNDCLIFHQATLPAYRSDTQIFDFGRPCAYKAALSPARNR
jgi:hypothetical protein